jgi:hypothetical protein
LNEEWLAVLSWAKVNDLEVNIAKTKVMTVQFAKKISPQLQTLYGEDGTVVEEVPSLKLLGLIISNDLKWNSQVDACLKKANRNVFLLRQLKYGGLPDQVLWNVYNALIRSFLAYAAPATLNMASTLLDKLQKIEKRVSKIIGDSPPVPLKDFVHLLCLRLMKGIALRVHHPLRHLFKENSSTRNTRRQCTLLSPFAKTNRYKNSFIKYAVLI